MAMRSLLAALVGTAAIVAGVLPALSDARLVSAAGSRCVVPDVRGKPVSAARTAIKRRGCAVGKIGYAPSGTVAKGSVVSQRPGPGARRKAGAKVALTVSKGSKLPPHVVKKLYAEYPEGTLGAFGSVWVSIHREAQVERLDPQTGKTVATLAAGFEVGWPVAGPDAVWAEGDGYGQITRIDPATNQATTFQSPFSSLCGLPAATSSMAIWVDDCDGNPATLDRIDATTHSVTATVAAGNGVDSMVPDGSTVLAADYDPPEILRFDAVTGTVLKRIAVTGCPLLTPTAYAFGYLWVGQKDEDPCVHQQNVLRIDVDNGAVTTIPVGGPASVATGDGYVWASAPDESGEHQIVSRIDPGTLAATVWTKLPMAEQPDGFAFIDHALWIGDFSAKSVWVVKTQ